MKKGYTITPIIFLAVFLIVLTFSFYLSAIDSSIAGGINQEGKLRKSWNQKMKKESNLKTSILWQLYEKNGTNNKTIMEEEIEQETSCENVLMIGGSSKTTSLSCELSGKIIEDGIQINRTDFNTTLGHPFFQFNQEYLNYDKSTACSYYDYPSPCSFDEAGYENSLSNDVTWNVKYVQKGCADPSMNNATVFFEVFLSHEANRLTQTFYPFHLKDREEDEFEFNVTCS